MTIYNQFPPPPPNFPDLRILSLSAHSLFLLLPARDEKQISRGIGRTVPKPCLGQELPQVSVRALREERHIALKVTEVGERKENENDKKAGVVEMEVAEGGAAAKV